MENKIEKREEDREVYVVESLVLRYIVSGLVSYGVLCNSSCSLVPVFISGLKRA